MGKVDVFSFVTRVAIPCNVWPFSPNGRRSLAGGSSSSVCSIHAVFGTDKLKNALRRFNQTLTRDSFGSSVFGRSSTCKPAWPSGKTFGWEAQGPRFDSVSALLSLQKLSVDTLLRLCPSQLMKQ